MTAVEGRMSPSRPLSRADGGSLQNASEDEGISRRFRPRSGSRRPAGHNGTKRRFAGECERAGERDIRPETPAAKTMGAR